METSVNYAMVGIDAFLNPIIEDEVIENISGESQEEFIIGVKDVSESEGVDIEEDGVVTLHSKEMKVVALDNAALERFGLMNDGA